MASYSSGLLASKESGKVGDHYKVLVADVDRRWGPEGYSADTLIAKLWKILKQRMIYLCGCTFQICLRYSYGVCLLYSAVFTFQLTLFLLPIGGSVSAFFWMMWLNIIIYIYGGLTWSGLSLVYLKISYPKSTGFHDDVANWKGNKSNDILRSVVLVLSGNIYIYV